MQKSRRSSLSDRCRTALRVASCLLVASSATGCVASKHYDEARSVAENEAQGHARTRERLAASMQRIHALESELAEKERSMAVGANAAEESKLASTVASKEREAAVMLVEQLRSELARTGDHLLLFAKEKRDLAQTLLVAEQRMGDIEIAGKHLSELVATTRDLALVLADELEKGSVELGARDGQVIVGIQSEKLFVANGDTFVMDAGPVLSALGKVSVGHPTLRVLVREPPSTASSIRLQRLGDALRERGVADSKLVLPSVRSEQPAPAPVVDAAAAPANGAQTQPSGQVPGVGAPSAVPAPAAAEPAPARYEIAFAP
jgi:hypothetical protein